MLLVAFWKVSYSNWVPDVISVYEKLPNSFIRKKALEVALDQIRAEDRNTKYLDIGPVY